METIPVFNGLVKVIIKNKINVKIFKVSKIMTLTNLLEIQKKLWLTQIEKEKKKLLVNPNLNMNKLA